MKIIATVINDLTYDQRMIRICTSLARAGYKVELVGRILPHSKPIIPQLFQQKRLKCFFNKGKLFYIEYNIRLFFYLFFQKTDVICSVDLDTILAGFMFCKLRNRVQVYDAHEYFTELPEVIQRPVTQRIWSWVADLTIPKIKYCYTVGESLAEIFEQQYGVVFSTIRNVNYKQNRKYSFLKNNSSDKIFLYQGALNEGRGLESMISAMQYVENAQFWLAGEGDLSQTLRDQVSALNLEHRVRFLGFVLPEDLPELTKKAYIGINLLENKGQSYYYSLANKTFDYIQANLPAIHIGFPEYQRINRAYEVAILVDDLETKTLLKAINTLMMDDSFYKKLKDNCNKAAAIFCWENEEIKLLDIYKEIERAIQK